LDALGSKLIECSSAHRAQAHDGDIDDYFTIHSLLLRLCFEYGASSSRPYKKNITKAKAFRRSGAIFVAKTLPTEFCYGATGENYSFGNVNNPWDLGRVPGGSSSGAAVSVATDMCRIAIGSDTGGSVRLPASLCGVAGLRPTFGSVPNTNTLELTIDYDTVGPIARSVADLARAYAVIAGHDPQDANSSDTPLENFLPGIRAGVRGLKIGVPKSFYFEDLQEGIGDAVHGALTLLEAAGAKLMDIEIPAPSEAQRHSHISITRADMADLHREEMADFPDRIGSKVLDRLRLGLEVTGRDYAESRRWMANWKILIRKLFTEVDLFITPTVPIVAPSRAQADDLVASTLRLARFTSAIGAAGIPSMTVPCGFGVGGMPIGFMIAGGYFREDLVFRAGVSFQDKTEYHLARPALLQR